MVFSDEYTAVNKASADMSGQQERKTNIIYHDLVLPNTEGVWVDQFGRPPFAGIRRAASSGFMDFMRAGASEQWMLIRMKQNLSWTLTSVIESNSPGDFDPTFLCV